MLQCMANSASILLYVGEKTGVKGKEKFSKENPENIHSAFLKPHLKNQKGLFLYACQITILLNIDWNIMISTLWAELQATVKTSAKCQQQYLNY